MKKIMFDDKHCLTEDVLKGRKTMTRRAIPFKDELVLEWSLSPALEEAWKKDILKKYARYKVGEIVAIAQSYRDVHRELMNDYDNPIFDNYKERNEDGLSSGPAWRNKMFTEAWLMPHHIKITDRKVERLQDISREECLLEGVYQTNEPAKAMPTYYVDGIYAKDLERERILDVFLSPFDAFAALIDAISGKGTWKSDPWVIAYSFELYD